MISFKTKETKTGLREVVTAAMRPVFCFWATCFNNICFLSYFLAICFSIVFGMLTYRYCLYKVATIFIPSS